MNDLMIFMFFRLQCKIRIGEKAYQSLKKMIYMDAILKKSLKKRISTSL